MTPTSRSRACDTVLRRRCPARCPARAACVQRRGRRLRWPPSVACRCPARARNASTQTFCTSARCAPLGIVARSSCAVPIIALSSARATSSTRVPCSTFAITPCQYVCAAPIVERGQESQVKRHSPQHPGAAVSDHPAHRRRRCRQGFDTSHQLSPYTLTTQ